MPSEQRLRPYDADRPRLDSLERVGTDALPVLILNTAGNVHKHVRSAASSMSIGAFISSPAPPYDYNVNQLFPSRRRYSVPETIPPDT